jgi:hypothetical protein
MVTFNISAEKIIEVPRGHNRLSPLFVETYLFGLQEGDKLFLAPKFQIHSYNIITSNQELPTNLISANKITFDSVYSILLMMKMCKGFNLKL